MVAIAITLLAIDLPVPGGDSGHEFWVQVRHNSGHYAAFLISFFVIAGARGFHHDIFRYVKRTDARLRQYNTAWLLTIVLIPFATRMLTPGPESRDTHALQFAFYAVLQVLESGALFVMLRHIMSHEEAPDFPRPVVAAMAWRSWSLVIAFGLSIPVFFVTVNAWVLWIAVPPLIDQVRRHRPPARQDR